MSEDDTKKIPDSPFDAESQVKQMKIEMRCTCQFGERKRMCIQRLSSYQDLHRHLCDHIEQCVKLNRQSVPCHLQYH
jgi:hypothetical protein